ncbi:hypothetical protein ACOSQ2_015386 [Xanthoceras sorbifolium]
MKETGIKGGRLDSMVLKDGEGTVSESMKVGVDSRKLVTSVLENSFSVTGGLEVTETGSEVKAFVGGLGEGAGLELMGGEDLICIGGPSMDSEVSISSPFKPKLRKWKKAVRLTQQKGSPILKNKRRTDPPLANRWSLLSMPFCGVAKLLRFGVIQGFGLFC